MRRGAFLSGPIRTGLVAGLCFILPPVSAIAQDAPPPAPAVAAPDPDRVAAARELLDSIMPPESRNQMMVAMIEPSLRNIEQGILQSPQYSQAIREDPETQRLFTQLMQSQRENTSQLMAEMLPGLIEAMSRAYARRFTVREMRDMTDFFESRAGQAYLREAPAIMADPDVAAWQRQTMARSMQMADEDLRALMARLEAGAGTTAPNRSVTGSNLDAMRGGSEQSEEEMTGE